MVVVCGVVEDFNPKCAVVRPNVVKSKSIMCMQIIQNRFFKVEAHTSLLLPSFFFLLLPSPQVIERLYRDVTDIGGRPTPAIYPTKDQDGNPLVTEFGLSTYKGYYYYYYLLLLLLL